MRAIFLPFLFLLCAPLLSLAQAPTLTEANVAPIIGDQFVIHNCSTIGVDPGPSGADTSWDFSSLITLNGVGSIDTGRAVISSSTQNFMMFPESNLAIVGASSSLVVYYIYSPTKLSQNGIFISPTEFTSYTDPMDQLQFPFTYNNTFTDVYAGTIVYTPTTTAITALDTGTITVTADAYGTLTLPGKSGNTVYPNTLRIHSLQFYTDSVNIAGTPTVQTFNVETYTWYTPGYHNALLTIINTSSASSTSKQVYYSAQQLAGPESVSMQSAGDNSFDLYPNPAGNNLNIAYNTTGNDHVRIALSDVLGREVAVVANTTTQGPQSLTCNVSSLPKGMYLAHFQTNGQTTTKKVTIQ